MQYFSYKNYILKQDEGQLELLEDAQSIESFTISKDSPIDIENGLIAYFSDNILNIFNLNTLTTFCKIEISSSNISCMSIANNRLFVAFGTKDGRVIIYSLIGAKAVFSAPIFKGDSIDHIKFLDDGCVVVTSKSNFRVISCVDKKNIAKLMADAEIKTLLFANELIYYSFKGEIKAFNIKTKKIEKSFQKISQEIEKLFVNNDKVYAITKEKIFIFKEDTSLDKELDINSDVVDFILLDDGLYECYQDNSKALIGSKTQIDEADEEASKLKTLKFLTVDDSATMRMIIKKAVSHNLENIEIYEASDGKEAMKMLEKHPDMDVMFLDWNMPHMNGEEVVDMVAGMKKYHVKIIMATTEGASDKVKKMVTKGVKGYLIKPFNPKAVIAVATKMAELCRSEKE